MKVILLERVERLGALGDVVTVKDGFARNFLLPRSKALRATAANARVFDAQRAEIENRNAAASAAAAKAAERIDGQTYMMVRQAGDSGQLYGSVSGRDVADAVNAEGGKIDRAMVVLDRPIKTLGLHAVKVRSTSPGAPKRRSVSCGARTSSPPSSRPIVRPMQKRPPTCSRAAPAARNASTARTDRIAASPTKESTGRNRLRAGSRRSRQVEAGRYSSSASRKRFRRARTTVNF
jgi:ribosomal protein L9